MKTNPNDLASTLTKRELSAKEAMKTLADTDDSAKDIADQAVKIADALIAALNKEA